MTIIPSSEVRILRGCKLKPDYKHSIWWVSAQNQYNYFAGLTKYTLNSVQYTRSTGNSIKVPYTVGQLLDCNYMIITNVGHENKHYYAFITDVEYVSETTSRILYEIDLIQTWYFECTLMPCLVEREHSATDNIGDNLLPESVPLGDYITYESGLLSMDLFENRIVVASTFDTADGGIDVRGGGMYGNTYSGLFMHDFPCTDEGIEALHAFISIDTIVPATDIVSIFMAPAFCVEKKASVVTLDKCYAPFGNFTPNNNKLFTYPYNYLQITAGPGNVKDFKYELFNTYNAQFYLRGDLSCEPGIYLEANNYKKENGSSVPAHDITESMMLTGFPQCPWCSDMFLAFLAQVASTAVSVAKDVGVASGLNLTPRYFIRSGRVRWEKSGYDNAVDFAGGLMEHFKPEQSVRGPGNNSTLFNVGELTYMYANKRITEAYARMIDAHFDMYGYATNRVKVPDRTSRPQWNYVKTADCCISASLPSDIVTKIQDIYNDGITFWCWGNNVGNYSLDNRPK